MTSPATSGAILGAILSGDLADCTTGERAAILAFLRAARQLADEETATSAIRASATRRGVPAG